MDARNWFVAFHLIGLFVYFGGLLTLTRVLAMHAKEEAAIRARLAMIEKRIYFGITMPGLIVTVTFGLLLFLGVGSEMDALTYLKPYVDDEKTVRSLWYSTFHAKFVLFALLVGLDVYMGRQIVRLGRDPETPPSARRFKILHSLIALILVLMVILMKVKPLSGAFIDEVVGTKTQESSQDVEQVQ